MTEEQKRGRGRPPVTGDDELVTTSLRLTRLQLDTFKSLGAGRWLREYLDKRRAKMARDQRDE
ncbi:hypothetical protein [Paraburkholderia rhynchosiae]|uniref:Uncharacterized protein n=1 Tax=Paraburkholderia rhynchosiae TaxID=487049 RepID=A0A2N7WTR9_9BURK|nr:hypothetical protein [Paraburkholderia rhynchosiae]PMS32866.1 hypothetical protein C0Z16_04775 [Paraburkholderia rhynchosiae]CAB3645550.1 hypothetical protein LMG27174_00823 [Paraburkholderia rhynchosiae]